MDVPVNYVAVLLAGVANMVAGFLWYSPMLFGNSWMKLMGLTKGSIQKAQKEMGKLYALSFVLSLVTAFVLSHVMTMSVAYFGYPLLTTGLTSAFWMWFGFVLPVQTTGVIFGKEKGTGQWKLLAINTGYQLVAMLLMAVVLAIMS
jgi:hypothetical protein